MRSEIDRPIESTPDIVAWKAVEVLQNDRDNTLASIIHELSNPLTVIMGTSELLLQNPSADVRIARIHSEAERSMRIIRNLMDLCRARARDEAEGRVAVDLNEAVRHASALCEDQLERHNVNLVTELPWRSPFVFARPGELTQVFLNLIVNAIQAIASVNQDGNVVMTGTQLGSRVCITIEDDGPGFTDTEFRRLFEPYFTTKSQGVGLGLNLCRKIVRSAGGDLWASRNSNRGAIFTIELPLINGPVEMESCVA
jgi:signal transduction histidine kinase